MYQLLISLPVWRCPYEPLDQETIELEQQLALTIPNQEDNATYKQGGKTCNTSVKQFIK